MNSFDSDEDDELIFEGDVYLNGELNNELFLFQYPQRPNDRFYGDHGDLFNISINKADNSSIKLNYNIDPKNKNCDQQNVDNKDFSQTLLGQKLESNTNYCIGIFRNNNLYLNPLENIMQFRHDFSNMEKEENKKRKERIPTKKELLNNLNQENQKETEKWVDLKYYKKETYQSHQIIEKLSCEKITTAPEITQLSQEEYFKLIFKNINNEAVTEKLNEKVYLIDKIISCNDLLKLPLQDQIQVIFKKASVLSFDIILNILGVEREDKNAKLSDGKSKDEKLSERQALELILGFGQILKSGNFVYKSENKYDYVSDLKKKEYMVKQRNTIIQFLQNNSQNGIKKNYFNGANEDILKEILSESCECINGSYFLRESIFSKAKSEEFKNKHKEIYQKGISYWRNFAYDTSINLSYVSDEQILKRIEDLEIIENNIAPPANMQKRKYSLNYPTSGISNSKRDENGIKAPLALTRNNNSGRDLLMDSDYKIERMKDGNEKLPVKSKFDVNAAEKDQNKMEIDDNKADIVVNPIEKKKEKKNSEKNLIKIENANGFDGNAELAQQAIKSEAGINLSILRESLLKNFIPDSINKKSDIINSILSEFPDLKNNSKADEITNKLISELFVEIRNNLYLKEIEDREANRVWTVLLDMFFKGNSYKKGDIKKELNDKNIQITDQNLNKILKRIAVYTNSSWNLKE